MNKAASEAEATASEIVVPQAVDMETAGSAGTSKRKANESAQEPASNPKRVAETIVEHVQDDEYFIDLDGSQDDLLLAFYSVDLQTRGSKFDQDKFFIHADRLPDVLRDESLQVARKHGFMNERLWLSFVYFCFALSNKQPKELHVPSRAEVVSSVVAEPHEDIVLTQGYLTTKLDMAWRTRSKNAVLLYRRLFPNQALQLQSLASWLVAVCVFRYPGKMELLNSALLTHTDEQVSDSLRSVQSFTALLKKSLEIDIALRTSVGAVFDPQDGRRQIYRDPQPRIGGDDKRIDHLHSALDNWCDVAPQVAKSILVMCTAIGRKCMQELESACEATMEELLKLELLGRAFTDTSLPLEERACCYHGKFMMDTVYALVIATMCESVPRDGRQLQPVSGVKGRCSCDACSMLLQARRKHMFIGPALRDLLLALKQPAHGEAAGMLRQTLRNARSLLGDMNELLRCDLDLYALQFLPCIWGKWLAAITRLHVCLPLGSLEFNECLQKLKGTRLWFQKLRIFQLETIRLKELWIGLDQRALRQAFLDAPLDCRRRLFDECLWSTAPTRKAVLALLKPIQ